MKDTDELTTPYESVFLEMEEFHRTEAIPHRPESVFMTVSLIHIGCYNLVSFHSFNTGKTLGIPTTCTLN